MSDHRSVSVGGIRLAFAVHGHAPTAPMVLLHGGSTDGSTWDRVLPALSARHLLYSVDLRGHGRSDQAERYSLELMRDDIAGLLDALDLNGVTLVGHSMGGVVAYLTAHLRPGRVSRLVLVETPPPDPMGFAVPDHEIRGPIVRQLNNPNPAWWNAVEQITCPVLVVAGGPDSFLPQDRVAAMASRFRHGRLHVIRVGHHVHRDAPDLFAAALLEPS